MQKKTVYIIIAIVLVIVIVLITGKKQGCSREDLRHEGSRRRGTKPHDY
ncbi:MAG: hypothetical protein U5L09_13645 [Bacteroidales bacterium]|nr:hypothetical protein [Bacteroidales bacterium]